MKFIIQHNLMNADQLEVTRQAVQPFPHEFVGLIPFSHEITSNEPLVGWDYIPYGSTLMTTIVDRDLKWKGLFFDLNTFNYLTALHHRPDMLNHGVIRLDTAIQVLTAVCKTNPGLLYFTRPSHDLKQFSGQVIEAQECLGWFKSMMECETSGSYKLEASTDVVLCPPQNIQAEWRWFVVGGKVVSGSLYRSHGQLRKERVTDAAMITEAQAIADVWLPSPCCVMDLALVNDELKVIEFNCINSSGWYDNDVTAIFKALYEYTVDHAHEL